MRVYGRPKPSRELLKGIETVGLLQPLIVNETENGEYQLLVGGTRREAWQMLYEQKRVGSPRIQCRFVKLSPLKAEQLVIESNRQRLKTKGQIAREASELMRIEKALAQQRMKAGKGPDPGAKLPKGRARDLIGKKLGVSGKTVEKMATIVLKADEGIPRARAAMESLDKNETSVDAAYREVVKPKAKDPTTVQTHEKGTRVLNDFIQEQGVDARVSRSKTQGKFHLTLRDLIEEQIQVVTKTLKAGVLFDAFGEE